MLTWAALCCAVPAAQTVAGETAASDAERTITADPDLALLESSLGPQFRARRRSRPDWWRDYSDSELPMEEPALEHEIFHLVLQEGRFDGPDMLTLRYPFVSAGRLRTFAGAGLGQVVYLADNGVGPILLFGRAERHRSVRAAAELGTELRLNAEIYLGADVRWLDLAERASLLRTDDGMIDADAWAARLILGWRFR